MAEEIKVISVLLTMFSSVSKGRDRKRWVMEGVPARWPLLLLELSAW